MHQRNTKYIFAIMSLCCPQSLPIVSSVSWDSLTPHQIHFKLHWFQEPQISTTLVLLNSLALNQSSGIVHHPCSLFWHHILLPQFGVRKAWNLKTHFFVGNVFICRNNNKFYHIWHSNEPLTIVESWHSYSNMSNVFCISK